MRPSTAEGLRQLRPSDRGFTAPRHGQLAAAVLQYGEKRHTVAPRIQSKPAIKNVDVLEGDDTATPATTITTLAATTRAAAALAAAVAAAALPARQALLARAAAASVGAGAVAAAAGAATALPARHALLALAAEPGADGVVISDARADNGAIGRPPDAGWVAGEASPVTQSEHASSTPSSEPRR